jgi:hypothetical protein
LLFLLWLAQFVSVICNSVIQAFRVWAWTIYGAIFWGSFILLDGFAPGQTGWQYCRIFDMWRMVGEGICTEFIGLHLRVFLLMMCNF